MPLRQMLLSLLLFGIGPALALAGLGIGGFVSWPPLLAALAVVLCGNAVLAWFWQHDLDLLVRALRGDTSTARIALADRPYFPSAGALLREIDRLAREHGAQARRLEQMRRADAAVVERLPDPLIVLDTDRAPLRANAAARAAFGRDIAAVLRHPELRAAMEQADARGLAQAADVALSVPVARVLCATVVPMDPPLADGGTTLLLLSDRTQERAVEQMRADFVANASHELRTPLASVIGFIDTLRGPAADDPQAQQRFLDIMAEQGARMTRLIDDLLSLSRIELTEHLPPTERVDLPALFSRVAAGLEPRLADAGVRLEMRLDSDLPAVAGDADQLTQVFQNLLDNAVKYGAERGTVRVAARLGDAEPPGVWVSVRDEGAGIPPEHLPRLTERFYRVDKGRSRAAGGTGLGLSIVKHIVNRHRGQLRIESEVGKGTTVSVWLPLAGAMAASTT